MTFDEYQEVAYTTAVYPKTDRMPLAYPALGLAGEAGEVAEKIKKLARDHKGKLTSPYREEIIRELGDVLWYISAIAWDMSVPLSKVVEVNIQKLSDRKRRSMIQGEGDSR